MALTNVYIDGFNLYNGLKRRAKNKRVPNIEYRWLNLVQLARTLLPDDEIQTVKYFTSPVKALAHDPDAPKRQAIFLAALRTLPELEIEPGKFHKNRVKREYVNRPGEFAVVWDYKEKRSDVNLATRLLQDAYEGNCEQAAVMSADSDLVTPIEIANERLPKGVVILNPNLSGTVRQLEKVAERYIWISENDLRVSQLPYRVRGRGGKILQRPPSW